MGSSSLNQELNLGPLHWELGVLTTGPGWKSQTRIHKHSFQYVIHVPPNPAAQCFQEVTSSLLGSFKGVFKSDPAPSCLTRQSVWQAPRLASHAASASESPSSGPGAQTPGTRRDGGPGSGRLEPCSGHCPRLREPDPPKLSSSAFSECVTGAGRLRWAQRSAPAWWVMTGPPRPFLCDLEENCPEDGHENQREGAASGQNTTVPSPLLQLESLLPLWHRTLSQPLLL